ncbi:hypothetical protein G8Y85_08300 [Staphylococcus sp. 11007852]|uniref:hypothetical protein n=1 Tax=Staphylococcus TaxID=1279 RepID=UPI0014041AB0|nr:MULTISPECIES: hypothetical protein [Staphylococcus]NHM75394.1 hypothetical protein [Staphylococcus sp. 11007852]NJH83277.1 hypothetical protein [Staphylococcus agnetis]
MKLTLYDLTNSQNDIRKYLVSKSKIYVNGDKLYDVVIEVDDYKSERDTLIEDITRLRDERDMYKQKIVYISNQYSTEIEQALNNKELQESLFLLEKIKMDLDEVLKDDPK